MNNLYELIINENIIKIFCFEKKIYFVKIDVENMVKKQIEIGEAILEIENIKVIEESELYIYLINSYEIKIYKEIMMLIREICPMLDDKEKTLLTLLRNKEQIKKELSLLRET